MALRRGLKKVRLVTVAKLNGRRNTSVFTRLLSDAVRPPIGAASDD